MNLFARVARRAALAVTVSIGGAWPVVAQPPSIDADQLSALTFRNIGPANMSGRIVDLAVVESDPYVIYAASATGGLWKSTDNAVTFTPLFEHESVHSIGAIAVHPGDPSIVWVGTGERANRQSSSWGDGIYKSVDEGERWTHMGLRDTHHIGRIALHPSDPNVVYVAALGHLWGPNAERGLFKSMDGGATWNNILFIDEDTGVVDVAVDPTDPDILYAASYQRRRSAYGFDGGGPGSALYTSADAGNTWHELTTGLPEGDKGRIGMSIYRSDPRIVYVSIEQGRRYNASTAYLERAAGIYRSEDHGENWEHMSDWNPRPMYASQILVDPNDDQRIYMMNSYSYSDDGGKTFTTPEQSLHGDDHLVWVDPNDSRHIIKADDGGIGISYDRGQKWLYVTSLPVSQYYRVAVDMRTPFWVYGGLQDNGSWAGPSATYYSSGILNDDWVRIGGGDGFKNLVDATDNRTVYTASQYLGLSRFDLISRERRSIRPDSARGSIRGRRNWTTWGRPDVPEPQLGNAMAPANWDAPFILSPHDPRTIYAGTNELWRSTDRGDSWTSLGNLTTGIDRSTLTLAAQMPDASTLSLDDGIPYYPTLTAIAESPLRRGLLYVGTDDGNVQVSENEGRAWTNVADRFPGLPPTSWVAGIEASQHDEATVYVAFDNHRSDDFGNHLYRSTDRGQSWSLITGDLPANRVIRAVHEDPRNADLLYIGTEFGFFFSLDEGRRWTELGSNLPRLAVNDFVIHPRDNDLVLGTHGRGIWILDNLAALQELTPAVRATDAHLFSIEAAAMIRYSNPKAHAGDMIFRGENPPAGAIIDYYLRDVPGGDVTVTVHTADRTEIRQLEASTDRGINRVIWDLRYPQLTVPSREAAGGAPGRDPSAPDGPFVVPGRYTVRLQVGARVHEQPLEVRADPRINVMLGVRRSWTNTLLQIGALYESTASLLGRIRAYEDRERDAGREPAVPGDDNGLMELKRVLNELQSRTLVLYNGASAHTGPLTLDQRSRIEYFADVLDQVEPQIDALER